MPPTCRSYGPSFSSLPVRIRTTSQRAARSARSLRRSTCSRRPTCSSPWRPGLSYSTAIRSSGITMSGQTSRWSKNGRPTRTAFTPAVNSRRSTRFCRSCASTADEVGGAHSLANASPTGKRRRLGAERPGPACGAAARARISAAGRGVRRPRRRRALGTPGRPPSPAPRPITLLRRRRREQVPHLALPEQQHLGRGRDLREGDALVQLRVVLPDQCRIRGPGLAKGADREWHVGIPRELPARPPRSDGLCHAGTLSGATHTIARDNPCEQQECNPVARFRTVP